LAFDQSHSRRGTASPGRLIDSGVDLPDAPVNVGHVRSGEMSASLDLGLVLSNLGLAGDRVIQVITASVFLQLAALAPSPLMFCPSAIFGDSRICAHGDALRNASTARV
jgi:hypothetical protein